MAEQAKPRGTDPSMGGSVDRLLAWLQQQYALDPQGTAQRIASTPALSKRFGIENGRVVERHYNNWLIRNPWIFPLAGIGAGAGLAAAGVGGGAAGGGAAGGGAGATGAGAGAGTAAATGAGIGLSDILRVAAPAGMALAGRGLSGGGGFGGGGGASPELAELLQEAMRRMRAQEPLFNAVNRQALAGLPTYARGE